jgi:hypothetical protein
MGLGKELCRYEATEPVYGWRAMVVIWERGQHYFSVRGAMDRTWHEPWLLSECTLGDWGPIHRLPYETRLEQAREHLATGTGHDQFRWDVGCGTHLADSPGRVLVDTGKLGWVSYGNRRLAFFYLMCYGHALGHIVEYEHGLKAEYVEIDRVFASPQFDKAPKFPNTKKNVPRYIDAARYLLRWAGDVPVHLVPAWRWWRGLDHDIGNVKDELFGVMEVAHFDLWLPPAIERWEALVEDLRSYNVWVGPDLSLMEGESQPSPAGARRRS